MSPRDQDPSIDDDHHFDLLVDGELGEATRRELLSRLDDEPGGWRRCALAFLEAQSWKQDLGAIVAEPAAEMPSNRPAFRFRLRGAGGTLLAMAVSFLAALLLVGLVRGVWGPGDPAGGSGPDPLMAGKMPKSPATEPGPGAVQPPGQPEATPKVYMVELPAVAGPDGRRQTIPLLAVEGEQFGPGWLRGLPGPISPEVLQQWEEAGLQVRQRRRLLPLRIDGDRRAVFPVDQLDVHYVGNPTY